MKKDRIFYARKCEYTGKGMSQGYVFCDDSCMIDDGVTFFKEIRKDRKAILERLPDNIEDIREYDEATNYTEEDFTTLFKAIKDVRQNIEWEEVNGKLISIEEYEDEEYDKIKNGEL